MNFAAIVEVQPPLYRDLPTYKNHIKWPIHYSIYFFAFAFGCLVVDDDDDNWAGVSDAGIGATHRCRWWFFSSVSVMYICIKARHQDIIHRLDILVARESSSCWRSSSLICLMFTLFFFLYEIAWWYLGLYVYTYYVQLLITYTSLSVSHLQFPTMTMTIGGST